MSEQQPGERPANNGYGDGPPPPAGHGEPPPFEYAQPPPGYPPPGYPPSSYPAGPQGYGPVAMSPSDERTWAMLAHLSGLFLGFLGPLLVMLIQGPKSPFVRDQSVEALNFQLTVLIGVFVSIILAFVLIGFLLIPALIIGALVFEILASIAANRGERYRYPVNIRMVH